jgi:membrane protein implicated in regulation of membrane protease activity
MKRILTILSLIICSATMFGQQEIMISQYMFNGLSINRDLLFFTFASLISIFLLRKIFKSKSDQKLLDEEDIN